MSQFSFPVLENDELLHCLCDMDIQVDGAQLAKPTYEVFRPVFEQLVIELTGVTREELTQPVFTAMDAFEFPELHDESIPCYNFLRQLSKLMLACGVKDFSWRDVFKPEPLRLRRNLSAIINFCKFREEKVYLLEEMNTRIATLTQETAAAEDERAKHAAELRRLYAERATQQQEVQRVEAQDAELVQRNALLNKQQAALQQEARALKQAVNQATDAASQAKLDVSTLQQESEQLQDQVVQSPDKMRQAIAELASSVDARRAYYAQLSSTAIDHDRKLEMVVKFDKEVGRCVKVMEELEAVIARKKDVSQQVKDGRQAISLNERMLAEVAGTHSTLRRNIDNLTDKAHRQEQQASLKLEAAASCVEEQLKSREAAEAENAAIAARVAEEEAAIRSLREHMAEMQTAHETSVRGVLEKYATLRAVVSQYNSKIIEASG